MGVKSANLTIRVMTYNIHHAEGMDGNINLDRIANLINSYRTNFVGLQEVDRHANRSNNLDMVLELARLTGMYWAFGKNLELNNGDYGNAILSSYPILDQKNRNYKMVKSSERRGLLQVLAKFENKEIVFMNTHIDHCIDDKESISNAEEIKESINSHGNTPVIVCGDFNKTPESPMIKEMEFDLTNVSNFGDQSFLTYPSSNPETQIDHIFTSKDWKIHSVEIPQSLASDHLPLVAEISLNG